MSESEEQTMEMSGGSISVIRRLNSFSSQLTFTFREFVFVLIGRHRMASLRGKLSRTPKRRRKLRKRRKKRTKTKRNQSSPKRKRRRRRTIKKRRIVRRRRRRRTTKIRRRNPRKRSPRRRRRRRPKEGENPSLSLRLSPKPFYRNSKTKTKMMPIARLKSFPYLLTRRSAS